MGGDEQANRRAAVCMPVFQHFINRHLSRPVGAHVEGEHGELEKDLEEIEFFRSAVTE